MKSFPGAKAFWWQTGAWKEPQATNGRFERDGPVGYFNPQCSHERTSYDVLTCDACIAYTKWLLELRAGAEANQNAREETQP